MCATGQEEREVDLLVPKEEREIDYVTFEPYKQYFPSIERLRHLKEGSLGAHCSALSSLSRNLLKGLGIILSLVLLFALSDIDKHFTLENMLVVFATFLQAIAVLYLVHWRNCRFILSLDAVIKFFASGFLFGTSLAIVSEMLISTVVSVGLFFVVLFELGAMPDKSDPNEVAKTLIKENAWLGVVSAFINAFAIAAVIEELCKYFGFWMVEHPDLPSPGEESCFSLNDGSDEENIELGAVSTTSEERNREKKDTVGDHERTFKLATKENSLQRSLNSNGTGITVAMVTVALGFACCENLEYIFSTSDVKTELFTLLIRSVIPVHALAAAIQSIGVCRRDLEGDRKYKLGRIIFPAVLLHGSFDFFLMVTEVLLVERHVDDIFGDNGLSGEDIAYNAALNECKKYDAVDEEKWPPKGSGPVDVDEIIDSTDIAMSATAFGLALSSVIAGAVYYVLNSRAQKARLEVLDSARKQNAGEEATRGLV